MLFEQIFFKISFVLHTQNDSFHFWVDHLFKLQTTNAYEKSEERLYHYDSSLHGANHHANNVNQFRSSDTNTSSILLLKKKKKTDEYNVWVGDMADIINWELTGLGKVEVIYHNGGWIGGVEKEKCLVIRKS